MKEGLKYTRLISQKDYLQRLSKKGGATKDVVAIASRMVSNFNVRRHHGYEKFIMNLRIKEKWRQIAWKRKEWKDSTRRAESGLPLAIKTEYRRIKQEELRRV